MEILSRILITVCLLFFFGLAALIIGAPFCAWQYSICDSPIKLAKWMLPVISILLAVFSVWMQFDAGLRYRAEVFLYMLFGDYVGPIVIEGVLPFCVAIIIVAVTVGTVMHDHAGLFRRK